MPWTSFAEISFAWPQALRRGFEAMQTINMHGDGRRHEATVLMLDPYDRKLLSIAFLSQVTSGVFLSCFLAFAFAAAAPTGFMISFLGVGALVLFISATVRMVVFFLWACAIAFMWRATIFAYALGVCLAWVGDVIVLHPAGNIAEWSARAYLSFIFSLLVLFRLLLDGSRLAATRANERELFIAGDPRNRGARKILAAVAGIHPICGWIPSRSRRAFAGMLFVLSAFATGGGILVAFYQLSQSNVVVALAAGAVYALIAAALRTFGHLLARVSAERLIEVDQRAPILFLRSFKDDQVRLKRPKRGFVRGIVGNPLRPKLDHVLLEEYTSLGPVVAIGMPGTRAPFGASRVYVNESEWKNAVSQLAKNARAIVIVVDDTAGVHWEISHIIEDGHLAKTLYLLPPRFTARSEVAAQFIRRALADNECALAKPLSEPCIGWYRASDGEMVLLVSSAPDQTSYISALRLFRQYGPFFPKGN